MEYADSRGSAAVGVRKSLRAFKQSPAYRQLLEGLVLRKETATMADIERRRLRLDKVLAGLELERLKAGEPLSEFQGVVALRDSLAGLIEEVGE